MKSVFILLFMIATISCVNAPQTGNIFSQEMDQIDDTFKVSPNDSEEVRRNKEVLAGNARVEIMKARESKRVLKNAVLRTTLSERQCPEWRPYFALEEIECKATYEYALFLRLSCENKNHKISDHEVIKWKVANKEGLVRINKMDAIFVRFQKNRVIKSVGGPPFEDPELPSTFELTIADYKITVNSNQDANESVLVPNLVCQGP